MKKIYLFTAILLFLSLHSYTACAGGLDIDAKAYIVIDAKTQQVLVEYNSDQKFYPASTTKIMTAILAIEKGDMNQLMTASSAAVLQKYIDKSGINLGIGINGSNIGIVDGEELRLEDLLNALLIKSANDAANVIAENISPTRADFIDLMNQRAAELGATNTNFTNACGLDVQDGHPDHLTTARDLAKISSYAMGLPTFREIVSKIKHVMPDTNKHPASFWPADYLTTTNKLLLYTKYKSPLFQVTGIKTGYTVNADFNMVAAGKNEEGMELISVIFGAKGTDSHYAYSKQLLEYGFSNFSLQKLSDAGEKYISVPVQEASSENPLDLVTESEFKCVLPNDKDSWKIDSKQHIETDIKAPVNEGDVLGYIEYSNNGFPLGKVNLIAASSVEKMVKPQIIKSAETAFFNNKLLKIALICLIVIFSFLILRRVLRKISRSLNSRRQED